jgi:hypothetical protein
MFCPKCGSQNLDGTKFCRGCGADVSNALAVVDPKLTEKRALSEKHIELFSSGLRGVLIGTGFMLIAALAFALSTRGLSFALFALAFAFFFLGTGISRLVHSRGLNALNKRDEPASLPSGQTDYIQPSRSVYETDSLPAQPLSVTEKTTNLLEMGPDGEPQK